jgi:hypothetical protein
MELGRVRAIYRPKADYNANTNILGLETKEFMQIFTLQDCRYRPIDNRPSRQLDCAVNIWPLDEPASPMSGCVEACEASFRAVGVYVGAVLTVMFQAIRRIARASG